jgi:hypothetical protein
VIWETVDYALDFLLSLKVLPVSVERTGKPTNSEVRRWLENGAVSINGLHPKPKDLVSYPVWNLVFFPNSKRRTTMNADEEAKRGKP